MGQLTWFDRQGRRRPAAARAREERHGRVKVLAGVTAVVVAVSWAPGFVEWAAASWPRLVLAAGVLVAGLVWAAAGVLREELGR